MPQMDEKLKGILQKMIDAGETEEMMAAVVRHHNSQSVPPPTNSQPTPVTKPGVIQPEESGDWWGGFRKSMQPGGEADQAALQGLKGFAKGAILDLPTTIMGGLKSIGNAVMDPSSVPGNLVQGAKDFGRHAYDTTMRAGSDPESFGRLSGQLTGQPLAMELGLPPAIAATKAVTRGAGTPVVGAGRLMKDYQPLTGMLPRIAEIRTARNIEGGLGRGIEAVGEAMKGVGKPKTKVVPGRGQELSKPSSRSRTIAVKPPEASSYRPSSSPMTDVGPSMSMMPGEGQILSQLEPSSIGMDTGPTPNLPHEFSPDISPRIDILPVVQESYTPSSGPMIETGPSTAMVPGEGQVFGQMDQSNPIGIQPPQSSNYTPSYPQFTMNEQRAFAPESLPSDMPTKPALPQIAQTVTGETQPGLFDKPPSLTELPPVDISKSFPPGKKATNLTPENIADFELWHKYQQLYNSGNMTEAQMAEWTGVHNRVKNLNPNGPFEISPYRFEGIPEDPPVPGVDLRNDADLFKAQPALTNPRPWDIPKTTSTPKTIKSPDTSTVPIKGTDPIADLKIGTVIRASAKDVDAFKSKGFEIVETMKNGMVRLRKIK